MMEPEPGPCVGDLVGELGRCGQGVGVMGVGALECEGWKLTPRLVLTHHTHPPGAATRLSLGLVLTTHVLL